MLTSLRAKLLHWVHDVDEITQGREKHRHPHWQMELIRAGSFPIDLEKETVTLEPGDILLLPPQALHGIFKSRPGTETYSFKFEYETKEGAEKFPARILKRGEVFPRWLADSVCALLQGENQQTLAAHGKTAILEYLLSCAADYSLSKAAYRAEPELAVRLREAVLYHGKEVDLAFAAKWLHLPVSGLKYRFRKLRKSHPEYGNSPSEFCGRICLEMIENYLEYSSLSIGEIADAIHFPDIYALSRFYAKKRGIPPSEFRRRAQNSGKAAHLP